RPWSGADQSPGRQGWHPALWLVPSGDGRRAGAGGAGSVSAAVAGLERRLSGAKNRQFRHRTGARILSGAFDPWRHHAACRSPAWRQRPPHCRGDLQSDSTGAARSGRARPAHGRCAAFDQGRSLMRVALVDYDSGNLHSAEKAFALMGRETGAEVVVTSDPEVVARADRLVLPGDGAFPACRAALEAVPGMVEALREAVLARAVPFMGICVGMQMLAEIGHEYRDTAGLGWIGGEIDPIRAPGLKVPHMGWNDLTVLQAHPLLDGISTGDHAYFVHSWQFRVNDPA